jgi:hypothetical protein
VVRDAARELVGPADGSDDTAIAFRNLDTDDWRGTAATRADAVRARLVQGLPGQR